MVKDSIEAYGNLLGILRSPFLLLSVCISTICYGAYEYISPDTGSMIMAMFLVVCAQSIMSSHIYVIGDSQFKRALSQTIHEKYSLQQRVSASCIHFISMPLVAIICITAYRIFPCEILKAVMLLTFIYATSLLIASALYLFRIVSWYKDYLFKTSDVSADTSKTLGALLDEAKNCTNNVVNHTLLFTDNTIQACIIVLAGPDCASRFKKAMDAIGKKV